MRKSKSDQVNNFLDEIIIIDAEKFKILNKLREIVLLSYPNMEEAIKYGGIIFLNNDVVAGLFVRKNHISFEFTSGVNLSDPDLHLEGTGKLRRHLKIKSLSDIKSKKVDFYVNQLDVLT